MVGTVTGKDGLRPDGRLYYMFSGTLDDDKLNEFINGASTQEFGESITRVMDTAGTAFSENAAAGSGAPYTYNGYSELQPSNITFNEASEENSGRFDGTDWIDIPAELRNIPVRISLGKDVVSYYADPDFTVPAEEANALYMVNRTYEYTTLVDGSGEAVTLGDLIDGSVTCSMGYSDVEVFSRENTSQPFEKADGYDSTNVEPIESDRNYGDIESKMEDIKRAILDNINDGDTTNDFWNQADSSFGLYITYEYIASNVCLSRYVKEPDDDTCYETAFSPAKLLTPGIASIVPEYKVYKKSPGSDAWKEVTPNSDGEY